MENFPLIVGLCMSLASLLWVLKRRTFSSVGALLFWLFSTIVFGTGYRAAYLQREAGECRENLAYLSKGLHSFAEESGHFPASLKELGLIPICPSSGKNSYSASYQSSAPHTSFKLTCGWALLHQVTPLEVKGQMTEKVSE